MRGTLWVGGYCGGCSLTRERGGYVVVGGGGGGVWVRCG